MTKEALIYNIYLICLVMSEKNISYKKAQEILFKTLGGDQKVIDTIPKEITETYTSVYSDISMELSKLTPQDKKFCVENLLKETYLMISYLDKTYDTSLSYIERERGKHNLVLKQVTLSVLRDYIGKGENLKEVYNSFKEDYTKYCAKHIAKIAKMLDDKVNIGLEEAISESEIAANYMVNKYPNLKVSSEDFRTVYESDIIFESFLVPITEEEKLMFNKKAV